jgi:hypothetical protein
MAAVKYCQLHGLNPNDFELSAGMELDAAAMKNILMWRGMMSLENSTSLRPHYARATALVHDNWGGIEMVAKELLKRERFSGWDLRLLMEASEVAPTTEAA